jgi:hypothetical protein
MCTTLAAAGIFGTCWSDPFSPDPPTLVSGLHKVSVVVLEISIPSIINDQSLYFNFATSIENTADQGGRRQPDS